MSKAIITAKSGEAMMTIERTFDALREKVFAAMTQKDKLEKWWVGNGNAIEIEQLDVRDGGCWRFVQTDKDGHSFGFFGTYHEVTAPERVVQTFEFDGLGERGHVCLERMELTEVEEGKTRLLITSTFLSVADRDGMIANGMEEGMQNTYNQLDEVLRTM